MESQGPDHPKRQRWSSQWHSLNRPPCEPGTELKKMPSARKCTARRKDGRPCQAWAKPGGEPAFCSTHTRTPDSGPGTRPGPKKDRVDFYRPAYTMKEVVDLLNSAIDKELSDELDAARVAVRRTLQQLEQQLLPTEYAQLVNLIFRGTRTIAGLLQAQLDLSRDKSEFLVAALAQALDEIGKEKDADL